MAFVQLNEADSNYVGEVVHEKKEGLGCMRRTVDENHYELYVGGFQDDLYHGKGQITRFLRDTDEKVGFSEGFFIKGKLCEGSSVSEKYVGGILCFVTEFYRNGQRNDQDAVIVLKEKQGWYRGGFDFLAKHRSGFGKLIFQKENSWIVKYSGEFRANKYHGYGRLVIEYPIGFVFYAYEGDFVDGLFHGYGSLWQIISVEERPGIREARLVKEFYRGSFRENVYDGYGRQRIHEFDSDEFYEYSGFFRENKLEGRGNIYHFPSSCVMSGTFVGGHFVFN